jgi:medium-chain acyl-[acyl-carrier-protein] hydrolase
MRTRTPGCALRLFCFHGAGGAAHSFRSWGNALPATIEVCPIQLPGRLTRARERPYTRFVPLVRDLVDALAQELDRPFAFFGHSMGSLVAFETSRELRRRGLPLPVHLIVAARRAPHLEADLPPMHGLRDPELLAAVQFRYQSIPEEVLREPDLVELILPVLRADIELHETYSYEGDEPLAMPITAMGGDGDAQVGTETLAAWRDHTKGKFVRHMLAGNHFFHETDQKRCLLLLSYALGLG